MIPKIGLAPDFLFWLNSINTSSEFGRIELINPEPDNTFMDTYLFLSGILRIPTGRSEDMDELFAYFGTVLDLEKFLDEFFLGEFKEDIITDQEYYDTLRN